MMLKWMGIIIVIKTVLLAGSLLAASDAVSVSKPYILYLPLDILQDIFTQYLGPFEQYNFYKINRELYEVLRKSLDQRYFGTAENPVSTKLFEAYMDWKEMDINPKKESLYNLLLTSKDFCFYSKCQDTSSFFDLSLVENHMWSRDICTPGETMFSEGDGCLVNDLLMAGTDPEVVAILVDNCPAFTERFSYVTDSVWLLHNHGACRRAKNLIDRIFKKWKIPLRDVIEMTVAGKHPYFPVMGQDTWELILKFSAVPSAWYHEDFNFVFDMLATKTNLELLIKMLPAKTLILNIRMLTKLLSLGVPSETITSKCLVVDTRSYIYVPDAFITLLLRSCVDYEDFVLRILRSLMKEFVFPFWTRRHSQLIKELGYSYKFQSEIHNLTDY